MSHFLNFNKVKMISKKIFLSPYEFAENRPITTISLLGIFVWVGVLLYVRISPDVLQPDGDLTYNFLAELFGVTAELAIIFIFVDLLLKRREDKKWEETRLYICQLMYRDFSNAIFVVDAIIHHLLYLDGENKIQDTFNESNLRLINEINNKDFLDRMQFLNVAITSDQSTKIVKYLENRDSVSSAAEVLIFESSKHSKKREEELIKCTFSLYLRLTQLSHDYVDFAVVFQKSKDVCEDVELHIDHMILIQDKWKSLINSDIKYYQNIFKDHDQGRFKNFFVWKEPQQ